MKLKIQLADVESAFACALISRGTSSAGINQGRPHHPNAKNVLKTKRNVAAHMPAEVPPMLVLIARTAIERAMPTDPVRSRGRRPSRSTRKMAGIVASQYSVPLHAARMRDVKPDSPISFS